MNTKHPKAPERKVSINTKMDDSENSHNDENDIYLFLLEIVDNEILCVCNLCNTGLENKSEQYKQDSAKYFRLAKN